MTRSGRPLALNVLAATATRSAEAAGLARGWGLETILVLIRDRDLGILRPALGFPQTLPGGPSWRALLKTRFATAPSAGTVAYPDRDRMVPYAAHANAADDAVFVLVGEGAPVFAFDPDSLGFPLLAALLHAEVEALNAAGLVKTAAKALDRAEVLTGSLDTARGKLTQALTEADRLNRALGDLNATLEARVEERTRQVEFEMAERQKTEEHFRQSQKMEAVGQLTGGLAHDFNNLLAGISGSLELMGIRLRQGRFPDVERYMAAAQGASKRAAALTHRLLAFSRRQTLDPKPTDVTRLATGMQELIQRTVGPGIPVEVVGATTTWPALVDASQLENALLNLCINARDAMPGGGRIVIETANKWMDERAARQHDMPEGQYLSMCVTDTGTGMPPEVVARVFEPFFTTKPIGEGTGLGLSMIYGFAQQSGGQVRIYSEVGHGTTVCIYLPRHYGSVAVEAAVERAIALPRSEHGETVLIVDDDPTVRMLVTDILEDLGYAAIEVGDSAAGLKVLQSDVRIDLLVTDFGLPGGMNGRQMADAARADRADLKVLFITGYAENAILGNGQLAPGMAMLTKPFAVDAMAARIRSMIESGKERARRS